MTTNRCPVTYFPVPTQAQFRKNQQRIQSKPYARYFDGDMWISEDVLPALAAPMEARDVLRPEDADKLLDRGYHSVENGYCELPDGGAYVTSRVPLPGVTGEMYSWWFWWHAVESERYTLWYPYNHVEVKPQAPDVLTRPGLSDEQRYVGTTHHVDEYIGPDFLRVAIRFLDPSELGLDTRRFAEAGIVGHACARVGVLGTGVESVTMIHLARETDDGIEQRSRYWIGHDPRLQTPLGRIPLERVASNTLRRKLAGARVGYEQLLHDQIEFTHLGTFLPELYREFGPR
jgi:2,4-diacetylphloroglucinol hydrolase